MKQEDKEKLMRVLILDTLVSKSGQQLVPDLIGQLTEELHQRICEVMARNDEYK